MAAGGQGRVRDYVRLMAHTSGIQTWIINMVGVRVRVDFILRNLAPPGSPLYVPTADRTPPPMDVIII